MFNDQTYQNIDKEFNQSPIDSIVSVESSKNHSKRIRTDSMDSILVASNSPRKSPTSPSSATIDKTATASTSSSIAYNFHPQYPHHQQQTLNHSEMIDHYSLTTSSPPPQSVASPSGSSSSTSASSHKNNSGQNYSRNHRTAGFDASASTSRQQISTSGARSTHLHSAIMGGSSSYSDRLPQQSSGTVVSSTSSPSSSNHEVPPPTKEMLQYPLYDPSLDLQSNYIGNGDEFLTIDSIDSMHSPPLIPTSPSFTQTTGAGGGAAANSTIALPSSSNSMSSSPSFSFLDDSSNEPSSFLQHSNTTRLSSHTTGHHMVQSPLHSSHLALSPPPPIHNAALPSPSALSMTSSMGYTPALSSGTMSVSSSQNEFPNPNGGGADGDQSPILAFPPTPQMIQGLGMPGAFFTGLPGQPMLKQPSTNSVRSTTSNGNNSNRVFINPNPSIVAANHVSTRMMNQQPTATTAAVGHIVPTGGVINYSPRPQSSHSSSASPASQWGPMPGAMPSSSKSKDHKKTKSRSVPSVQDPSKIPSRRGEQIGLDLGDFGMLDTLGTGTFGRVILAQLPPSPSRPAQTQPHYFAMKVLEKVTVVRLRQVEHLNSERATLAQVSHPFIVNLFCTFQDESNLYLLLEYVQGGELFSHLRRAGRFSADVARFYAANLILALEYLHKNDIIYRDLKPENLLIDSSGYLKITDFGFAKHVRDRTYTLCGTPEYLAPEIIMATGHGAAADWWALGVLIFELLAGYPPFFADNPLETYERILQGKFSFPNHVDSNARDLIKRLLTIDASKRLGNFVDGANGVKRHPWFEGVDWDAVEQKAIRAPIIPHASSASDTSNFERYPAATLESMPAVQRAAQAREFNTIPELLPRGEDPYGYLFSAF